MNKNLNLMEIEGLTLINDFLTEDEEKNLIEEINRQEWMNDLQRRVQHYGYKYDYKSKIISKNNYIGKLPDFCKEILIRIKENKISENDFDQLIVNEYKPGQGISPHVDHTEFFEDGIISISLGSNCFMNFQSCQDKTIIKPILLNRRSLICLTKDARYRWKHSIQQRKYDVIGQRKVARETRVSLTFRKVKGV